MSFPSLRHARSQLSANSPGDTVRRRARGTKAVHRAVRPTIEALESRILLSALNPANYASLGAFAPAPGTYTIDTTAGTLTGPSTSISGYMDSTAGVSGVEVFDFSSVNIGSGVTITASGNLPFAILSQGNMTIAGTIHNDGASAPENTSGLGEAGGAGGGSGGGAGGNYFVHGGGPGGGQVDDTNPIFGGSGGGGFGGAGATGADNNSQPSGGAGGVAYGNLATTLQGGSGGGGADGFEIGGAQGGGGGGATELGASGSLTIQATAVITADGGSGNQATYGGSGGGSGGGIFIHAATVTAAGTIEAEGGEGGGATDTYFPTGIGGGGGGGIILIQASTFYNLSATIAASGGTSGAINNNGGLTAGSNSAGFAGVKTLPTAASTPPAPLIYDVPNDGNSHTLVLQLDSTHTYLQIIDNTQIVESLPEADINAVQINGAAGQTDNLTVNYANGIVSSNGSTPIFFNGSAGSGTDGLTVEGNVTYPAKDVYTPGPGVGAGEISVSGDPVQFLGVSNILDLDDTFTALTVNGPAGNAAINIGPGIVSPGGDALITINNLPSIEFEDSFSTQLNTGSGQDVVTDSVDASGIYVAVDSGNSDSTFVYDVTNSNTGINIAPGANYSGTISTNLLNEGTDILDYSNFANISVVGSSVQHDQLAIDPSSSFGILTINAGVAPGSGTITGNSSASGNAFPLSTIFYSDMSAGSDILQIGPIGNSQNGSSIIYNPQPGDGVTFTGQELTEYNQGANDILDDVSNVNIDASENVFVTVNATATTEISVYANTLPLQVVGPSADSAASLNFGNDNDGNVEVALDGEINSDNSADVYFSGLADVNIEASGNVTVVGLGNSNLIDVTPLDFEDAEISTGSPDDPNFYFDLNGGTFTVDPDVSTASIVINGTPENDVITATGAGGGGEVDGSGTNIQVNNTLPVYLVPGDEPMVTIDDGNGSNSLVVNSSAGAFGIPIVYVGGDGDNSVELTGGTAESDSYTPGPGTGAGAGYLQFGKNDFESVSFTGVSTFIDVVASPLTVNGTSGNDTIDYSQAPVAGDTLAVTDAYEDGNTVYMHTSSQNGFADGEAVTVSNVGNGYDGTFIVEETGEFSFSYYNPQADLPDPDSDVGTVTPLSGNGLIAVNNLTPIEFSNKPSVAIDTGTGTDTVIDDDPDDTPSGLANNIIVNGGDPSAGDTLVYAIPLESEVAVLPASQGSGSLSVGPGENPDSVDYSGIANLQVIGTANLNTLDIETYPQDEGIAQFTITPSATPGAGTIAGLLNQNTGDDDGGSSFTENISYSGFAPPLENNEHTPIVFGDVFELQDCDIIYNAIAGGGNYVDINDNSNGEEITDSVADAQPAQQILIYGNDDTSVSVNLGIGSNAAEFDSGYGGFDTQIDGGGSSDPLYFYNYGGDDVDVDADYNGIIANNTSLYDYGFSTVYVNAENNPVEVDGTADTGSVSFSPTSSSAATVSFNATAPIYYLSEVSGEVTLDPGADTGPGPYTVNVNGIPGGDTIVASTNSEGPDTVQVNSLVAAALVTPDVSGLTINGSADANNLIVSSTYGAFPVPITFNGGPANGNSLTLEGGTATSDVNTPGPSAGEGSDVMVIGGITQTVEFNNVSAVSDSVTGPLTGNGTSGNDTITYSEAPDAAASQSVNGADEIGNAVTIFTNSPNGFYLGEAVTISGVGAGYNGTFTVARIFDAYAFGYNDPTTGLATVAPGGATATPLSSEGLIAVDNFAPITFYNKSSLNIDTGSGIDTVIDDVPVSGPIGLTGGITVSGGEPNAGDTLIYAAAPGNQIDMIPYSQGVGSILINDVTGPENVSYTGISNLQVIGTPDANVLDLEQNTVRWGAPEFTLTPSTIGGSGTITGLLNHGSSGSGPEGEFTESITYSGFVSTSIAHNNNPNPPAPILFGAITKLVYGLITVNPIPTGEDYVDINGDGAGEEIAEYANYGYAQQQMMIYGLSNSAVVVSLGSGSNYVEFDSNTGSLNTTVLGPGIGSSDQLDFENDGGGAVVADADNGDIYAGQDQPVGYFGVSSYYVDAENAPLTIDGTAQTNAVTFAPTSSNTANVTFGANVPEMSVANVSGAVTLDPGADAGPAPYAVNIEGTPGNDTIFAAVPASGNPAVTIDSLLSAAVVVTDVSGLTISGGTGNNNLTVDSTHGAFPIPITFEGGPGNDNSLTLQGGIETSDIYTPGPLAGAGSDVMVIGGVTQSVEFNGLAPVIDSVAGPLSVDGPSGTGSLFYGQGPASTEGEVAVNQFEPIIFTGKTTLALDGGFGSDSLTIDNAFVPTGLTGVTVDAGNGLSSMLVDAFGAAVNVSTAGAVSVTGQPVVNYANIGQLTVINALNSVNFGSATISARAGQVFTNVAAATFTGGRVGALATDFTATIDWGDGHSSAGTVTDGNGNFTVNGSHTYSAAGTYHPAVILTDSKTVGNTVVAGVPITVDYTSVDVAPDVSTVDSFNVSLDEDSGYIFSQSSFNAAFSSSFGNALQSIKITSLPARGTLTLLGVPVTLNQVIAVATIPNLVYTPNNGFKGSDSFGWTGTDGTTYAGYPANVLLSVVAPPIWLKLGSQASWNPSTDTLTVTGQSTIVADPGSAQPIIIASGAAAQLTIDPTTADVDVHLGGIELTNGAGITVTQIDAPTPTNLSIGQYVANNQATDHNVIVLGTTTESADPVFTIDATSTLDLGDNDLIYHTAQTDADSGAANLLALQTVVSQGRDGGAWDGLNGGLFSSVAENQDNYDGNETVQLAVVNNNDLGNPFSNWQVGTGPSETLNYDDIIIKYTYTGDLNLDGAVNFTDSLIFNGSYYADPATGNEWAQGNIDGDPNGVVGFTDSLIFNGSYNNGTPQAASADDAVLL